MNTSSESDSARRKSRSIFGIETISGFLFFSILPRWAAKIKVSGYVLNRKSVPDVS